MFIGIRRTFSRLSLQLKISCGRRDSKQRRWARNQKRETQKRAPPLVEGSGVKPVQVLQPGHAIFFNRSTVGDIDPEPVCAIRAPLQLLDIPGLRYLKKGQPV